jgi:hypothetical protein
MIYRYISSKVVIGRVGRYFEDRNWISTSFLDLSDAIQEVGYSSQNTSTKETCLVKTINHRAELPCDLEFIIKVEYRDARLPISKDPTIIGLSEDDYVWGKSNLGDFYGVQPPYIVTSFESGEIKIFYKKYETDSDGFLMIPDLAEYRSALEWFLIGRLILQGYKLKDASITHDYSMRMYETYRAKVKSKIKRFSRDERIAFSRMYNSLNIEFADSVLMDVE